MDIKKVLHKIEDGMLLGSVYDNVMLRTKYRDKRLSFCYNIMMGQKHRMLYYKYFKKKYYKRCTSERDWEEKEKKKNSDTVWICWLQGMEHAPELVQTCLKSVKEQLPDKKIILLNKENIFDYIELPDYIIEKWKKGIIGPAHFSDLVRLEILIKYGGYWIDSTVLCTDNTLFSHIENEPLFMFSFYYFGFNPEIMELNNWFIYSCTNNNILCLIRKFLLEYWKDHNRVKDYFVFQIMSTLAIDYYAEEFARMPIVSQVDAHILATYIYDSFDKNKYELLKTQTGIHKLSTRFEQEKLTENTFYDVVIRRQEF